MWERKQQVDQTQQDVCAQHTCKTMQTYFRWDETAWFCELLVKTVQDQLKQVGTTSWKLNINVNLGITKWKSVNQTDAM